MKFTKRVLALFLTLVLCLPLASPARAAGQAKPTSGACGDNATWRLDEEGVMYISGTGSLWDCEYNEKGIWYVTTPWVQAMRDAGNVEAIVVEEGITRVGDYFFSYFSNSGVDVVILPQSLTALGAESLSSGSSYSPIPVFQSKIDNVGEIRSFKVPFIIGVPGGAVEAMAQEYGVNFTDVNAFEKSIEELDLPSHAANYETDFYTLMLELILETVTAEGVFICEGTTLTKYNGPGGEVTIPFGVKTIGGHAFDGYEKTVTALNFPSTLRKIDKWAFSGFSELTELYLPRSVNNLQTAAFAYCTGLKKVHMEYFYPSWYRAGNNTSYGIFSNCTALEEVVVDEMVRGFNDYMFYNCTSLKRVILPEEIRGGDGYSDFYQGAFGKCTALEEITVPEGVVSIDSNAFNSCTALKTVNLPKSLKYIGNGAFAHCTALEQMTIPENVQRIVAGAFYETPWLDGMNEEFNIVNGNLLKYCGPGGAVIVPEGVTYICGETFSDRDDITSVKLPSTLWRLGGSPVSDGRGAFQDCDGLTKVVVPYGTTMLENKVFAYCSNLKEIVIPSTVTYMVAPYEQILSGVKVSVDGTFINVAEDFTIRGVKGSYAETYASENNYNFVPETADEVTQTVLVDGEEVTFYAYALADENGGLTNYVKLRDVAALLSGTKAQFEVGWDGSINLETGKAYTAVGGEMEQTFEGSQLYVPGDAKVNINGAPADLEAITLWNEAGTVNYFKLRDLGKTLGFNVGYNDTTGIFIQTGKPYTDAD